MKFYSFLLAALLISLANSDFSMNSFIETIERMCLDDWMSGYITLNEYQQYMKTADIHFVKDNDDPQPQKAYKKEFFIQRLKMFVKNSFSYFNNSRV